MTSIAYDGKTLAADSRETWDSYLISNNTQKIYEFKKEIAYIGDTLLAIALAGASSSTDLYLAYLHSDDFPANRVEHNAGGIIVGKYNVYQFEPGQGYLIRYPRKTKLGCGSGEPFVVSAMSMGMRAVEAVKHAMKFDMNSGGKIRSVTV